MPIAIRLSKSFYDRFGYDAAGRLIDIHRDGNAEPVTFTYGAAGQVSATSMDPMAHSPFSENLTNAYIATNIQKLDDIATSGIDSENIAILIASRLRLPNLSASHPHCCALGSPPAESFSQ